MPVVSNSDRKYKQRYFQCQERRRIEIEGGKTIASSAMEPLASGIHAVDYSYKPNDCRGDHRQQVVAGDGQSNKETPNDRSGVDCHQRLVKKSFI